MVCEKGGVGHLSLQFGNASFHILDPRLQFGKPLLPLALLPLALLLFIALALALFLGKRDRGQGTGDRGSF
jgi:hypothetical protein